MRAQLFFKVKQVICVTPVRREAWQVCFQGGVRRGEIEAQVDTEGKRRGKEGKRENRREEEKRGKYGKEKRKEGERGEKRGDGELGRGKTLKRGMSGWRM